MKKITSIIIAAIIILVASVVPAFAAEQDIQSTLTYEVPEDFLLSIPLEIEVGNTLQISLEQTNIKENKAINITIEGLDTDGYIQLNNTQYPEYSITARAYGYGGNMLNSENNLVGSLPVSEVGNFIEMTSYVDGFNQLETAAGTYTGTINFRAECVSV